MIAFGIAIALLLGMIVPGAAAPMPEREIVVTVDTQHPLHSIDPHIYGLNFATAALLRDLNVPLNRSGGNSASLYNWRTDARGTGADWYFESVPTTTAMTDQFNHGFVAATRSGGAEPMITIPMIGWAAKIGPKRTKLAAFSVDKYGAQQSTDRAYFADAGDGVAASGSTIRNDPTDAATPTTPSEATARVRDLASRWGKAGHGGIGYYILDNEPSLWQRTHRSVVAVGVHARDMADRVIATSAAIRAADPAAQIVAPEEWGWSGYFDSGFDQQGRSLHLPPAQLDRATQTGGLDYLPYLLRRWHAAGHPVDMVSVHFYPQNGEFQDHGAGNRALQLLRNRSTRALWDRDYRDPNWINANVALIPRLRQWVNAYYWPHTPIALTEYDWGGDTSMSGATAQADIWGIFGREGLDLAARWTPPAVDTPVYRAMRLIRNYDGHLGAFGDVALPVTGPADPDTLAAFAARRSADGAVTVLIINKSLDDAAPVRLALGSHSAPRHATVYRLDRGALTAPAPLTITAGVVHDRLPVQSIALYVIAPGVG